MFAINAARGPVRLCRVPHCICHFPWAIKQPVPNCDTHLGNDTQTQTSNSLRLHTCTAPQPFFLSQYLSPLFPSATVTCANAPLHRHIGLDYNLICSGRDGIEHQIIPNEENQSPGVQISWKLVNSDWFRQSSRQGGIWQITASQVVGGKRERVEERREEERKRTVVEAKDTFSGAKINRGSN